MSQNEMPGARDACAGTARSNRPGQSSNASATVGDVGRPCVGSRIRRGIVAGVRIAAGKRRGQRLARRCARARDNARVEAGEGRIRENLRLSKARVDGQEVRVRGQPGPALKGRGARAVARALLDRSDALRRDARGAQGHRLTGVRETRLRPEEGQGRVGNARCRRIAAAVVRRRGAVVARATEQGNGGQGSRRPPGRAYVKSTHCFAHD